MLETNAHYFHWRDIRCYYERNGIGTPIVLLHGFGAGVSGYQWRLNAPALAADASVFVPDLPGWGNSDRPRRDYNAQFYIEWLDAFLAEVVQHPAVVVGSFQTAAYALALAVHRPQAVQRLVLQTPSGLNYLRRQGFPGGLFYQLFNLTPLGGWLYRYISGRRGIRSFMRSRMYADPDRIDERMIEAFHSIARLPGGRWGAAAFLTGKLNYDVTALLPQVRQPSLVIWGDRTDFIPPHEARAFVDRLPDARSIILGPARIWLNDERAAEWNRAVAAFAVA
jgi:pimeloyl-ACP methyl ester carboxylesterase